MSSTHSRRTLLGAGGAAAFAASLPLGAPARAQAAGFVDPTSDDALAMLREGNRAFVAGEPARPEIGPERRAALAEGQSPFAVVLSCSDSRVPPEVLFGMGLGEIFVIRNAGNTLGVAALGSIEYGVAVLGAPLVVVLGHESCGAVKAAVDVVEQNATFPGDIGEMIQPIIPAVLEAQGGGGDLLDRSVRANVDRVAAQLRGEPLLAEAIAEGRTRVVGARYDLDEGRVEFFDAE